MKNINQKKLNKLLYPLSGRDYGEGFTALLGETIVEIYLVDKDQEILFKTKEGNLFRMYHDQVCCEDVSIEDICGAPLDSLIGNPILLASEKTQVGGEYKDTEYPADSWTWTFYTLATIQGSVDIRWYGESNGFYSENVGLIKYSKEK